ncbi:hypothetical protein OG21DRAFT_1485837 [Imleria badia]|nr:hypothetical protein OG21DRAFT_1485837 [Imleria badia]
MRDLHFLHVELHDAVIDYVQSTPSGPSTTTFPTLFFCDLSFQSLATVWRFFDHLCLPVIEQLSIRLHTRPIELELESFLAGLPGACNHKSLFKILIAPCTYFEEDLPPYHIKFQHLRPLTVFANIRMLHLMIPCGVDLNERELLRLASSWPHLEVFALGEEELYPASSSITPGGFVQLLGLCRSLSRFSFVFDTHDYTHIPQGHPWNGLGTAKNRDAEIRVLNSVIEEESVEALGNFFQVAPFPKFELVFGKGPLACENALGGEAEIVTLPEDSASQCCS